MEYFFLISSLPGLKLYDTPSITMEYFLSSCSSRLNRDQTKYLTSCLSYPLTPEQAEIIGSFPVKSLPAAYDRWENALRNSIAKIRAGRWNNGEAGASTRPEAGYEADADRVAQQAYAAANPLEREKILDEARWRKLDELARIYNKIPFSFDAVCAYAHQLQIAWKWAARKTAEANVNLDRAAESVQTSGK